MSVWNSGKIVTAIMETYKDTSSRVMVNGQFSMINQVAVKCLVLGRATVCAQVNHLCIYPTTKVNSAFHPSSSSDGWRPLGKTKHLQWKMSNVKIMLTGLKVVYTSWQKPVWQKLSITCHIGSHGVTCHPTQVNAPHLKSSQVGRYSIYLPQMDGRLSWP